MKPYLTKIQNKLKELAAEGRRLRTQAAQTSHLERYRLKAEANAVGEDAREHLLTYHALRGRHPALSESVTTRWNYYEFPKASRIVALVDLFFEGPEEERTALLEKAEREMNEWRDAVRDGKAADLHSKLRAALALTRMPEAA